jgi:RNA polymerase sigma factor (TIGR02999 family)
MATEISSLIKDADRGDPSAGEALFAVLYSELHQMAKRELGRHSSLLTISPTTLLHETYIDMAARSGAKFPDRSRFMGYAARVMRGLIIDHIRNRLAHKRGGQFEITSLKDGMEDSVLEAERLNRISSALDELAKVEPALADIVDLKFFCGFSFTEIAEMRGISRRTVMRNWERARLYLHCSIRADLS